MPTPLPLITALARTGALEQAWRLFREGGDADRLDDPAILAVKGRLLKDEGLRLKDTARRAKFAEAAAAYAAADAIDPQPYLAINVATLRRLAGDLAGAKAGAEDVLARLDGKKPLPETPYWLAATRAEALLLLGEADAAAEALTRARTLSPDNWEDQASTLRQLGLIVEAMGLPPGWLDPHRPPATLHYAGHLGVNSDATALRREVEAVLAREGIGFGHGALAAGADIIIAEALIARGAELHVHLPVGRSAFLAQSVQPYGADWVRRFEACSAAATSVKEATGLFGVYEPRATSLAADLAMGSAALQARLLSTRAVQLLVVDEGFGPYGEGKATARDAEIWMATGRPQHIVRWPRANDVVPSAYKEEGRADLALVALIGVSIPLVDALDDAGFAAQLDDWLSIWWDRLDAAANGGVQFDGHRRIYAFETPAKAVDFIHKVRALPTPIEFPVSIAGHYALFHRRADGYSGPGLTQIRAVMDAALPGATLLTNPLATTFALQPTATFMEPWGEYAGQPLYGLV